MKLTLLSLLVVFALPGATYAYTSEPQQDRVCDVSYEGLSFDLARELVRLEKSLKNEEIKLQRAETTYKDFERARRGKTSISMQKALQVVQRQKRVYNDTLELLEQTCGVIPVDSELLGIEDGE